MQGSKEQQREIRKPSSVINAEKQRKTTEWERLEISSRKLEITREQSERKAMPKNAQTTTQLHSSHTLVK